jgi:hypothetical protein
MNWFQASVHFGYNGEPSLEACHECFGQACLLPEKLDHNALLKLAHLSLKTL